MSDPCIVFEVKCLWRLMYICVCFVVWLRPCVHPVVTRPGWSYSWSTTTSCTTWTSASSPYTGTWVCTSTGRTWALFNVTASRLLSPAVQVPRPGCVERRWQVERLITLLVCYILCGILIERNSFWAGHPYINTSSAVIGPAEMLCRAWAALLCACVLWGCRSIVDVTFFIRSEVTFF